MADSLPAAEALRAAAAGLLSGDVLYFPVRHHSPACAWHVAQLIRARRPSTVLVEGPASFCSHIDLLVHPQARAPLALYAYCVFKRKDAEDEDDRIRRFAAYYPFCDYSPELVALREGRAAGAQLRFIDLELAEQCALDEGRSEAQSLLEEHHLAHSRYLKLLAQRTGCRDHDELWDHLFEASGTRRDTAQFVADVYAYCSLARQATPQEALERDGTLARERAMAAHVARAVAERRADDGPVLVVTGGFHTVALPVLVREAPPPKSVATPGLTDHRSALIRYSFDRLDRLNGYGSGMPAPAWYQSVWERLIAGRQDPDALWRESALAMILDIAARTRKTLVHENLPTASVIAAFEQAQRLAGLRSRAGPTRADVIDALTSCFVKGDADIDGLALLGLVHQAFAGRALGSMPPGASVPPLVTDFQWRARRQRLKIDETGARRVSLDLYRRPEHRATSRLMHGLAALGVPFGIHQGGPDFVRGLGLGQLHEHWEYEFSPATEAALVEASVYGPTLPEAVAARFSEELEQLEAQGRSRDASVAVAHLVRACVLGLHDHVARLIGWIVRAVSEDAQFASLAAATTQLALLSDSREPLEAKGLDELERLIPTVYERACFLVRDLSATPTEEQPRAVDALRRLSEFAGQRRAGIDPELFWSGLGALAANGATPPLLAGAASGLLYGTGLLEPERLVNAVAGWLDGRMEARDGVLFLRGVLQTAREAAWQRPDLLRALDARLVGWDDAAFMHLLPDLRLAFAEMTPLETDRIAEAAAGLHGAATLGPLVDYSLTEERAAALAAADAEVRATLAVDGLAGWLVPKASEHG